MWAFTNLEEVVYLFRPNREGEFLRDLLKDFHGVLVSDFYTAYDSLNCPQQKCLIHLIRDMNDNLLDNPFDEELQMLTKPFGALLRPIVSMIGEHGLRNWHLRRFKKHVAEFFGTVESLSPRSEVAQALRERLLKYQNKLFTFLDYDGVPWNNNNAENAIKRFAYYRAHASGMLKDSGVTNFLKLLSVCQTCKYKGLNFWKFLSSREHDIDAFAEKKQHGRSFVLEVYPEAFVPLWKRFKPSKERQPIVGSGDIQVHWNPYRLNDGIEMKKHPLPKRPAEWLREITLAMGDAREAKPFGKLVGHRITEADLYHLAPLICMKFRGRPQTAKEAERVT